MRTLYFERDGVALRAEEIALLGPAFRHGDAHFETMRVEAGRVRGLGFHLRRLAEGMRAARLAVPEEAMLREAVRRVLSSREGGLKEGGGATRLRLVVEAAPCRVWVELLGEGQEAREDGGVGAEGRVDAEGLRGRPPLRVGVASIPHPGLGAWGKSVSWQPFAVAMREAAAAGWDDALLRRGEWIIEATRASIVWSLRGALYRVDPALGGLASTTLARLEAGGLELRSARPDLVELQAADAVALVNAGGVLAIGELAGRRYAAPDGLALRLQTLVDEAPDEP